MVRSLLYHGLKSHCSFSMLISIAEATRLYPPKSGAELRKLHEQIIKSASHDHHKLAVLYYIRKDFPSTGRPASSRQAAERIARTFKLPGKYKILVDGLWFLDRAKFEVTPHCSFCRCIDEES